MTKEIWYEPHPVSPARKAELVAQDVTIIDAVFNPASQDGEQVEEKAMTVAELKEALNDQGIEIPHGAKKAELQALLDSVS